MKKSNLNSLVKLIAGVSVSSQLEHTKGQHSARPNRDETRELNKKQKGSIEYKF